MKIFSSAIGIVIATAAFSQNGSVDALRGSQEIRKNYINSDPKVSSTSKSLWVDPFIGTGGHGHTYPGAAAPFGMMQLSPDTRYDGWDGCGGYHYSDSVIYGFSHTHLSGTGVPDYCDLLIVPQNGYPKTTPGYLDPKGYGSRFSHQQENASPGYYEVKLLDPQINVRLTVTERAGMHEYTFLNKKGKKFILIDLDHRDKVLSAAIKAENKTTISGHRVSEAWAREQYFYFYLNTSIPYSKARYFVKDGQHKLLLTFPEDTEKILIKVGISAVNEEGAKQNLNKEIPDWDFDGTRARTVKKWNDELGKIAISTDDRAVMINFYTALYHSYLNPNLFSDVDGKYRGRDNAIHLLSDPSKPQYSVFSLWDTYRATHPLFTLTQVKRTNDFINTFLRQFKEGGDLPVWELAANETECMIGYHSVSVIADAYTKGIQDFDANQAMLAMIHTSGLEEFGKNHFRNNGYISLSLEPESVSKTLEYAYDDFCIAQMAKYLGHQDVYDNYMKTAFNFVNVFDPQTKFMRARREGLWFGPFEPTEVNFNYTEANSWQYSLYAPHAVGTLSTMLGGKDSLEIWLDRLFSTNSQLSGREQVDITGLIGQYAHGNEPSHHMAYLYNYTNAPHKTQFYVDKILKEMYHNGPDGLSGNEDCGQMSSWYVLSALGIYQIAPASPFYELGRPFINEASLQFEDGKKLTIKALNNSKENKYIQKVTLNGEVLNRTFLHHSELTKGGTLEIVMGNAPSTADWISAPTLENAPDNFLAAPHFRNSTAVFDDSLLIDLGMTRFPTSLADAHIEYRVNNGDWKIYRSPFTITESSEIEMQCIAVSEEKSVFIYSAKVKNSFTKRDKGVQLKLKSEYANQYAAGGPNALIDGVLGGMEFRTGDYQGYWAQDVIAEVSFDAPRLIKEIGLSCIQDMKSWIFYPSSIEIQISYDGVNYTDILPITDIPLYTDYVGPTNHDFVQATNTTKPIKSFRIMARNFGKCPEWHLGAGSDTWLFTDEIIFR